MLSLKMSVATSYPCSLSHSCAKNLTGLYDPNMKTAFFLGKPILIPTPKKNNFSLSTVLGVYQPRGEKRIYVDLGQQRLYAYEGNYLKYSFLVSTGLWNRTPTGDFTIWVKLRYTRMSGGNSAIGTYYDLPNVPYVMFFSNASVPKEAGYSLHGTYWHDNFGHPMSHGCVNMKTEEVALLYEWANPTTQGSLTYASANSMGTKVTIFGVAPTE